MRIFIIWLFLIIGYMLFLDGATKGDKEWFVNIMK